MLWNIFHFYARKRTPSSAWVEYFCNNILQCGRIRYYVADWMDVLSTNVCFFRCVATSVFCTQSTVTKVGINETRHLVKLESAPVSILKWRLNYPLILLIWNDMNRFSWTSDAYFIKHDGEKTRNKKALTNNPFLFI